jgi:hypothetical protein
MTTCLSALLSLHLFNKLISSREVVQHSDNVFLLIIVIASFQHTYFIVGFSCVLPAIDLDGHSQTGYHILDRIDQPWPTRGP